MKLYRPEYGRQRHREVAIAETARKNNGIVYVLFNKGNIKLFFQCRNDAF